MAAYRPYGSSSSYGRGMEMGYGKDLDLDGSVAKELGVMEHESSYFYSWFRLATGFVGNFGAFFVVLFINSSITYAGDQQILIQFIKGLFITYFLYILPVHLAWTDVRSELEVFCRFLYVMRMAPKRFGYFHENTFRFQRSAICVLIADICGLSAAWAVAGAINIYVQSGRDQIGEINVVLNGDYSKTIIGLSLIVFIMFEGRIWFVRNMLDNEQNIIWKQSTVTAAEAKDHVLSLRKLEVEADTRLNMGIVFLGFWTFMFGPYLQGLPYLIPVLIINPMSGHTGDMAFFVAYVAVGYGIMWVGQEIVQEMAKWTNRFAYGLEKVAIVPT